MKWIALPSSYPTVDELESIGFGAEVRLFVFTINELPTPRGRGTDHETSVFSVTSFDLCGCWGELD